MCAQQVAKLAHCCIELCTSKFDKNAHTPIYGGSLHIVGLQYAEKLLTLASAMPSTSTMLHSLPTFLFRPALLAFFPYIHPVRPSWSSDTFRKSQSSTLDGTPTIIDLIRLVQNLRRSRSLHFVCSINTGRSRLTKVANAFSSV